jgi:hypothetical protein
MVVCSRCTWAVTSEAVEVTEKDEKVEVEFEDDKDVIEEMKVRSAAISKA